MGAGLQGGATDWDLLRELPGCPGRLLQDILLEVGHQRVQGSLDWGAWGEDLFMQRCMDDAEVGKISDFLLVKTGTCPKQRPPSEKDNTKYVPPCTSGMDVAGVHPLRTLDEWSECYDKIA